MGLQYWPSDAGDSMIEHPDSSTIMEPEDIVYILGKPEEIAEARELLFGFII